MQTTGTIHQGKSQEGIYSTIKITNGIPFLLCQQERWETITDTRLQIPQPMDNQEHLSVATHIRNHGQDQSLWSKILHQIRCSMGIQQCMHQGQQPIESSIQDQPQIIQTNGHVLWIMQLPLNISSNDKWHSQVWNQRGILHRIHGQHSHFRQEQRRSQMLHQTHPRKPPKSWPLPQTIKMRILQNKDWISWPYYWRRQDDDGPHKTQWNLRLAKPQ